MKNYNKLVAKIQEAVPEIMELKFGCEVIWNKEKYTMFMDGGVSCDEEADNNFIRITNFKRYGEAYPKKKDVKILGRPITLEDVLVAINKNNNRPYFVGDCGNFGYIWCNDMEHEYCGRQWTFNKSLEWHKVNKPETVEFLIDLIK
jgi:hypothetical protein